MRRAVLVLSLLVTAAAGCSGDDACDPNAEACVIEKDVTTITVQGGEEDEDICQSWTLNNPTELWVSAVGQSNQGGYHHANWFFVPDDQYVYPDGEVWSCQAADFDEIVAALIGGYLFALSTQSEDELQGLPEGSAIRIPPYSRIVGASHILNASPSAIETTMHLAIHTIPPEQVVAKMAPAQSRYHDLTIAPDARSSFTSECLLDQAYDERVGGALDYKLHHVLFHYHQLGAYAQVELAGGPNDGEVVARHDGYGENLSVSLVPPLDLAAKQAQGLRFTCGYDNPRSDVVGWGIGDQEMCVIALQAETDLAFAGDVGYETGAQVGVAEDGELQYSGPCSLTAFKWDFTKPGGPPR